MSLIPLLMVAALLALVLGGVVLISNLSKRRELERTERELQPVRDLIDEDVTAMGVELQDLDLEMAGRSLDAGATADYQRALDAYDAAKLAVTRLTRADEARNVTEILEDGRYAMACVRARVEGSPIPARRPPCFFDARHGLSVVDVDWAPAGGAPRPVPACALDAERVRLGAEPDSRKVMVGSRRLPYWQAGPAYQPYAMGYYGGFAPMNWMFMGMLFGGAMGGWGDPGLGDAGWSGTEDAAGDLGAGEGTGEAGGDFGEGGDGGWDFGGGDGGGLDIGGFDF